MAANEATLRERYDGGAVRIMMRIRPFIFLLCVLMLAGTFEVRGAGQGDQVVVVYNTRVPESKGVAEHYTSVRDVPTNQVIGLDLPDGEEMSRDDFRERLQKPLFKALEDKKLISFGVQMNPAISLEQQHLDWKVTTAKVRYVLLCYGVPLRIAEDQSLREAGAEKLPPQLRRNEAAVDGELACIPIRGRDILLAGPLANPLAGATNAQQINPTNGFLIVTRLDGPSAEVARNLVDKAVRAEKEGLWGRAYFDLRGLTNGPYMMGEQWIGSAANICHAAGYETIVDTNASTFPASFPLSQVAFYAGWYDENASGPFARASVEFMPGAFAYHLHSFSAATLRSTTRQWAGPLLAHGATATMGCVAEPYLAGTPDMDIFFSRFIESKFSFGEAAFAAQRYLSWQTTVIGDPLYRPFARTPVELHAILEREHSKLIEWSWLNMLNSKLAIGMPVKEAIKILKEMPDNERGAVLQEKLADLFAAAGKPADAIDALVKALKGNPTPEQQIRVMLSLATLLSSSKRNAEAYAIYQQFLSDFPEYPDLLSIYKRLVELAHGLGKTADADKYQHEVDWLAGPSANQKILPVRRAQ